MFLSEIKSFNAVYGYLVEHNISSQHDIIEFSAVSYGDRLSKKNGFPRLGEATLDKDDEIMYMEKEGIACAILMRARYKSVNSYSNKQLRITTFPAVGTSLKRKSKYCPNGIRLTKEDLQSDAYYKNFVYNAGLELLREKQRQLALWLIELRKTNLINKDDLAALELGAEYKEVDENDKKDWLIGHDFTGIENFNYKTKSRPDGYGHATGTSMEIDFHNRRVNIITWSSDD